MKKMLKLFLFSFASLGILSTVAFTAPFTPYAFDVDCGVQRGDDHGLCVNKWRQARKVPKKKYNV